MATSNQGSAWQGLSLEAAKSVTFNLILEIKCLFFKNTVKILKFR